jgi:hypothetical protein
VVVPADVFEPDLIVTTDDGTELLLVVDAKLRPTDLADTHSQLKQYMLAMRCPVGLLPTPDKIRICHDRYLSATEESVELIGEYPAPAEWDVWREQSASPRFASAFEDAVRNWLEGLSTESGLWSLPNQGIVWAARPRTV